ncbi:MAG: hypothetical protein WCT41_02810 [Candidatus Paceibacterota bacterium]|jgi:hypothetical protein
MAKVHVERGSLGSFSFYNAIEVAKEHRGWALGTFVTDENNIPLTDAFEVKLVHYKVGDKRDVWTEPSSGVTLHIVLDGVQRHISAPNGIEGKHVDRVIRAGEANFFDNSIPHKWVTEEDGLQITIRCLHD